MDAARRMGVPYNTIPLKGARAEGVSLCLFSYSPQERGVWEQLRAIQASASPEARGSGGLLQERLFPFHAIIIP